MKRFFIYGLLVLLLPSLWVGCSNQTRVGGEQVTRVKEPFSQRKYRSNRKFFRAVGSAESTNLNFAKEQALFNAKKELASNVNTSMKAVTQRYAGERNVGDKMAFSQGFEDLTREVLNTRLAGVKVLGEQVFKKENNRFLAYTAVEIDMAGFYFALTQRIGTRREIKDYWDADRFREIYEEEMNRVENS
jgi:hypothetical protein